MLHPAISTYLFPHQITWPSKLMSNWSILGRDSIILWNLSGFALIWLFGYHQNYTTWLLCLSYLLLRHFQFFICKAYVIIISIIHQMTVTTGDPLHSRALAHSRAPLLTQPCPHCWHSRAPIVHTAVPRENNEHGCVYLCCRAVCKLPGCVEGHPWLHGRTNRPLKITG